jgi:hypothetical protein
MRHRQQRFLKLWQATWLLNVCEKKENKMISALAWVKKGAALSTPEKIELTDEEYQRIQNEMGVQLLEAKSDLKDFQETIHKEETDSNTEETMGHAIEVENGKEEELINAGPTAAGDLSIYNLDTYDNDEDENTLDIDQETSGE